MSDGHQAPRTADLGGPGGRRGRTEAIGEGFATLARWGWRILGVAAGVVVVGYVLGQLWVIVLPVLLALLVSTALWPPAAWLRRKGLPPALAALLMVVVLLLAVAAAVTLIVPPLIDQATTVADQAAGGLDKVQEWLTGPPLNLSEEQIDNAIGSITDQLQASATTIANGVIVGVSAVTNAVITIVVVLFLSFFFVKDGPKFLPWLRGAVGERAGRHLDVVLRRSWVTLGGFLRSQAAVGAIDGILIGIGLWILGVPLALPLAVLTFLGGFVPIVGALVAGALSLLVALVSQGPTAALIVLAVVVGVQQIEGNLLQPILQGKALRLHQGVILLAVTAGGTLYGIAGAFFAVPAVAVVAEIVRYAGQRLDARTGQATPRPPEEPERPGDARAAAEAAAFAHLPEDPAVPGVVADVPSAPTYRPPRDSDSERDAGRPG